MWSCDDQLGHLPLPPLAATAAAFADTACCGLGDVERRAVAELAADDGAAAARRAVAALGGRNCCWVSAAQERARLRSPAPVPRLLNHFAVLDLLDGGVEEVAARVAHALVAQHRAVELEQAAPLRLQKTPLCMRQFASLFRHCRTPATDWEGRPVDADAVTCQHQSDHICVLCRGSMFRVEVIDHSTGELVPPEELLSCMRTVVELAEEAAQDPHHPRGGGARLAALTALPRRKWAEVRAHLVGAQVAAPLKAGCGWELADDTQTEEFDGAVWVRVDAAAQQPVDETQPGSPRLPKRRTVRSVVVAGVTPGSTAAAAGVVAGMRVTRVGGKAVGSAEEAAAALEQGGGKWVDVVLHCPGDPRNQRAVECAESSLFILALDAAPADGDGGDAEARTFFGDGESRWFGHSLHLAVGPGSIPVRRRFRRDARGGTGLSVDADGVVTGVVAGSGAEAAGIRAGMRVVDVAGASGKTGAAALEAAEAFLGGGRFVDVVVLPRAAAAVVTEDTCVDALAAAWLAQRAHQRAAGLDLSAPAEGRVAPEPVPGVVAGQAAAAAGAAARARAALTPGSSQLHLRADGAGGEAGAGMRDLHLLNIDPEALVHVAGALAHYRLAGGCAGGCGQHLQSLARFRGGRQLSRAPAATPEVLRFVRACCGADPERLHPKGDLSLLLRGACDAQEERSRAAEGGAGCLDLLLALDAVSDSAECALVGHPAFHAAALSPPYTAARVCGQALPGAAVGGGVAVVGGVPAAPSALHFTYTVDDPAALHFCFVWTDPRYAEFPRLFAEGLRECIGLLRWRESRERRTVSDEAVRAVHRTR